MSRPLYAILLAGRIRPSPLSEALDVPALCLPVGYCGSLLDEWLQVLHDLPGLQDVRAVVNTHFEEESVRAILRASCLQRWNSPAIEVMAEPAAWRGAAGISRDVIADIADGALILICEAKRLPPKSLKPLLEAMDQASVTGAVGVCGVDQPAGVSIFTREAMQSIPTVGYYDLKEQFLPALSRSGSKIVQAVLDQAVWRLHDLESYLKCVQHSFETGATPAHTVRASSLASISPSATLEGFCIVEAGAVIEDGAVVHDSVVLWGATVGGGAVVTRSVIGPLATVPPRTRVVRRMMTRSVMATRDHVMDEFEADETREDSHAVKEQRAS